MYIYIYIYMNYAYTHLFRSVGRPWQRQPPTRSAPTAATSVACGQLKYRSLYFDIEVTIFSIDK